jgi:hypothetical protein
METKKIFYKNYICYALICVTVFVFNSCHKNKNAKPIEISENVAKNVNISKFPKLSYFLTGDSVIYCNKPFIRIYFVPLWPKENTNIMNVTIELSNVDTLDRFIVRLDTGVDGRANIIYDTLIEVTNYNTSLLHLVNDCKKINEWKYPIDIVDPFMVYLEWVDITSNHESTFWPVLTPHLKNYVNESEIRNSEKLDSVLLDFDRISKNNFDFSIYDLLEL